jgi:hypothetical protein
MYYVVLHLYRGEHKDDLLLTLAAHGVSEAVVVEGEALEQALTTQVPIFAGFRAGLGGGGTVYATVVAFTVREREEALSILRTLQDHEVDLSDHTVGRAYLLPAEEICP